MRALLKDEVRLLRAVSAMLAWLGFIKRNINES